MKPSRPMDQASPAMDMRARPTPADRLLDALAEMPVRRKVTATLLLLGVAAPLGFLLALHGSGREAATSALVLFLAAMLILLAPLSAFSSHVLALRSIRSLNRQCQRLKQGDFALDDLPPERGEEHDFQRLKRNLHWMGYALKNREERLAGAVAELADAQRQIGESIEYASQIQRAFLPGQADIAAVLEEAAGPGGATHVLALRQLGAVGGDACWARSFPGGFWLAVIDCTGHGVPGAFLTLIVHALFDRAARAEEESGAEASPGALLSRVNRLIKEALGQTGADALSDDGMDCSLCRVDLAAGRLTFAGARGALYIATGGATRVVKGTPRGAGYVRTPREARFNDVDMPLEPNARYCMTTDGLVDQPGGADRLPFGRRRLMDLLAEGARTPLADLGQTLLDRFDAYRGAETQRDDITALAFEIHARSAQ
ncbi:Serine phosphatase RsbU, regulator of sigma subunit [Humidesulfovibrio mexicanus]|uniref:Serine phosphatase RsbU, regulator of sigma subunit n=1 Tax=Humidesulfovibrio mexicanus TaxID=147047 RepID=A0A239DA56_9BACT|nr:SpoIIE family protein phosphatase [Humidesulfovibrio mexicanus]SNS28543.1 Serine phosphatase RsbU, regulator of sigma subunit [Humidesulfovibrio mexicanus]